MARKGSRGSAARAMARCRRHVARCAAAVTLAAALPILAATPATADTSSVTFSYTGAAQTFVVPAGVTSISVDAQGAQGGSQPDSDSVVSAMRAGGRGGRVLALIPVTAGQTISIYVGGQGINSATLGGAGGWNGGGATAAFAGSGGGASDVRIGGSGLGDRVIVAGGGGGYGRDDRDYDQGMGGRPGGDGGGLVGSPGGTAGPEPNEPTPDTNVDGGGLGGTQLAGGAAGVGTAAVSVAASAGSLGQGGSGGSGVGNYAEFYGGGGGGGGYYGGGGGHGGSGYPTYSGGGGGGGGSSFVGLGALLVADTPGYRSGDGQVTLTMSGSGTPSNDCNGLGTSVVDGFLDGVYVRLRTAPDPVDPTNTWVCVAVDNGTTHVGGKLVVDATAPGPVEVDDFQGTCDGDPGSRLLNEDGAVGPIPFDIDINNPAGQVWLCLSVNNGTVAKRVVVSEVLPSNVSFLADPATPYPYAEAPAPVGQPSSTCQNATTGSRTRLVNADVATSHLWLYTLAESSSRADVCVRAQTPLASAGGRLTVDGGGGQTFVTTDNSSDFSVCDTNVISLTTPPLQVRLHAGHPAWVCLQLGGMVFRRVEITTTGGQGIVTFTPDT
jgi:Glycine rich protein